MDEYISWFKKIFTLPPAVPKCAPWHHQWRDRTEFDGIASYKVKRCTICKYEWSER